MRFREGEGGGVSSEDVSSQLLNYTLKIRNKSELRDHCCFAVLSRTEVLKLMPSKA